MPSIPAAKRGHIGLQMSLFAFAAMALACGRSTAAVPAPGQDASQSGDAVKESQVYEDSRFGYRLTMPTDFVVSPAEAAHLAGFDPEPIAATLFMNPTMAAGDLAGLEPPDLEVRVYAREPTTSLESWLLAARFATAESLSSARPWPVDGQGGLWICQSTLLAPGCSGFVAIGDRVYQLTPATVTGESMVDTFSVPGAKPE